MSEPADEAVMDELMSAWDEMEGTADEPEENAPETTEGPDEEIVEATAEPEAPQEDAGEEETEEEADDEEAADEEEEGESQGEPEAEPVSFSTTDPAILAYLARYDNDPAKALKAAVELQRVLTRQGTEKNQALARVRELEGELEQARLLDSSPTFLSEEQRTYVENALESEQPQAWVMQAVRHQEFDLARAIVDGWAENNPYQAMRASQFVDQAEQQAYQASVAEPEQGINQDELFQVLVEHFPEMPQFEPQMVATLNALGDNHPLVIAAKSGDPQEKARAVISIYEIARASTATVSTTKRQVREQGKQAAVAAREAAVVSSSEASPSGGQTPRKVMIAPGLSLEDLDAEFAQHSQ